MSDLINLEILSKTFDDLPVGVGIFKVNDLEDIKSIQYVFMNKIVLYEMRKTKEEVFGKRIIEVAPEAYEHEGGLLVMETYRRIAEEGGSINLGQVEYSNHMVAGTYECSVHHIQDNYVYVMLRNVTELEKTKNELELKNKELGQFAFMVSHDLKEPLHTVLSFVDLINEDHKDNLNDEAKSLFSFIHDAVSRMKILITDILEYSTIGHEKQLSKVDCNDLLNNIQKDLAAKISEEKAKIVVENLPEIKAYKTELRVLFQNLISNALKFKKPDVSPEIHIEAKKDQGWIFSVRDNGIGISKENQDKVFAVFKRLHSRSEYAGTGIGLAHCIKIVDLHGGKIWVESELGVGSTFYFKVSDQL